MNTRVMIVDDHKMFRDGLRGLINAEPGMEVVGEAVDGREAIEMARKVSPDVVVMGHQHAGHRPGSKRCGM